MQQFEIVPIVGLKMGKVFQSNIDYFMSITEYIVSIEEIYGVLSLSMEFYLCLWSSIFVYGVLSSPQAKTKPARPRTLGPSKPPL